MKHLGDITKINGAEIEPVDCIIGGSPCQDLSVANGNRQGLRGERSGLFYEQIRVIKEMRNATLHTDAVRPRFMLWENVPGATSSGTPKGGDFQIVLTECVRVKEENAVPVPIPKGGWTNAGVLLGRGWSIAWKISDLVEYGCPQRRRRIALLCDFDGLAAPEIMFEQYPARPIRGGKSVLSVSESLSGDSQSCEQERKEITGDSTESIGDAD